MTNAHFPAITTPDIDIRVEGDVQVIRLTRAPKRNALISEMYEAMTVALDRAETDDRIAAHVFLGSGGVFTSGNDINDFLRRSQGALSIQPGEKFVAPATEFIRRLPRVTRPMLAGVDGIAMGVGVTLLLHCDLVYASPNAMLRAPFLDLGLVQEAASSVLGPQRLGYNRAFELFLLAEPWGAEQARAAGLVSKVVAASELEQTVLGAAQALAAKPRRALLEARRLLKGDITPLTQVLEEEVHVFANLMKSAEAREAFQAFLEKRKPDFARARRG